MRKTLIFILIAFAGALSAQKKTSFKNYMPFQYNNLWGIVDSLQNSVIQPTYEDIRILGNLDYVVLDADIIFDINTGETLKAPGVFRSKIFVEKQEYYHFNTEKGAILIDFKNQDTLKLPLKYDEFKNVILYDDITDKEKEYIIGKESYYEYFIFKNSKKLPLVIKEKFDEPNFLVDQNTKKRLFFTYIKNATLYIFDYNLALLHSLPQDSDIKEVLKDLTKKVNVEKLIQECFTCVEIDYVTSFSYEANLPKPFSVSYKNNRLNVIYTNKEGKTFMVEPYQIQEETIGSLDCIQFNKNTIVRDSRFVKAGKLMFPKNLLD
ncbi:hypothetical protein [Aquimarina algicola]|uniref:WG repeat-containing protein n=1 Tax=Aquimarina algicola TaxID=2589995 RepID=A0A504J8F2_9FLAO|nr:hypothetical protein [Aquimarina algicola]TPN82960.1 hypothetical protein FHK87_21275 [Aquimarina algicola]